MDTIEQSHNGWHINLVTEQSAATGLPREYRITWRTQQWECCGGQDPIRFDGDHKPFWIDGSYATVQDRTQQCGRCGKQHSAKYIVKEV